MYICKCISIYVNLRVRVHVRVPACVRACVCVHTHTYIERIIIFPFNIVNSKEISLQINAQVSKSLINT